MERSLSNFKEVRTLPRSPELAEIKVSYRSNQKNLIRITNSRDAFDVLFPLFDSETIEFKEEFFLLLLNRANTVLGWFRVSSGGTGGTVVDVRIVYILALLTNASSIILGHNHPSQNLKPSEADIRITNQIKEAGKIMGINVLDHLIISSNGSFFAFADEGII